MPKTITQTERLLWVFCNSRELEQIMQEIEDWAHPQQNQGEQAGEVLVYGQTDKARDGFILLRWSYPVPARLILNLMQDQAVTDFFLYEHRPEDELDATARS